MEEWGAPTKDGGMRGEFAIEVEERDIAAFARPVELRHVFP